MPRGIVSGLLHGSRSGIRILVRAGRSVVVGRRPDCEVVLDRRVVGSRAFLLQTDKGCLVLKNVHARLPIRAGEGSCC